MSCKGRLSHFRPVSVRDEDEIVKTYSSYVVDLVKEASRKWAK